MPYHDVTGPRWRWLLAGIVGVAFALRLAHVLATHSAGIFELEVGDSQLFDLWARAGPDSAGAYYNAPLYPTLLGYFYAVAGDSRLAMRIVQCVWAALACGLVADAARRLSNWRAGVLAGALLATSGPAIFYDGLLHKTSLTMFAVSALVWLMAGTATLGPTKRRALFAGLAAGVAAMTTETTIVFVPVLIVFLLRSAKAMPRSAAGSGRACAALALAGVLAVFAPFFVRNLVVAGELVPSTTNLGPNLYIGNRAGADGQYAPLVHGRGSFAFEHSDALGIAAQAGGQGPSPAGTTGYWISRTAGEVRASPMGWLELCGRKLALALSHREVMDTLAIEFVAEHSPVLEALRFANGFALLWSLALLGIWVRWSTVGVDRWLVWLLVLGLGSMCVFFVMGRLRAPVLPVLAVLGGIGCAGLLGQVRNRRWSRVGPSLVVVLSAWLMTFAEPEQTATVVSASEVALGRRHEQDGEREQAAVWFAEAIQTDPTYTGAYAAMSSLLLGEGRFEDALGFASTGLAKGAGNLAQLYLVSSSSLANLGQLDAAEAQLKTALREYDATPDMHFNLGLIQSRTGRPEQARASYRRCLALAPLHVAATHNLALLDLRAGDYAGAIAGLEAVLRIEPQHFLARHQLAWLLATCPQPGRRDPDRAMRLVAACLDETEQLSAECQDLRAVASAASGDLAGARRHGAAAARLATREQARAVLEHRLELYKRGLAFVDTGGVTPWTSTWASLTPAAPPRTR